MMISIEPNYILFVQILFVLFILKGMLSLLCGLIQSNILHRDKYGAIEIFSGILTLIMVVWVLIG